MIIPIITYGDPILRKPSIEINNYYPSLDILLNNMFDTMYHANGLGLSSPQIGLNCKLFIVDTYYLDLARKRQQYKEVFINAKIIIYKGNKEFFLEGCLSIPEIIDYIVRNSRIKLEYYDVKWKKKRMYLTGILSIIIQHEYDHLNGILFIDYLSNIQFLGENLQLQNIILRQIKTNYPIKKKKIILGELKLDFINNFFKNCGMIYS